ncbi:MAG: AI-2E family transporter [bacterium]|nr:AI-2E family transporter [Gammaproteobacteria bacterium]HIL97592.1 AI-2E family transporter [Pseudomonadales bacterium]
MIDVVRGWIDRFLSEEEAMLLAMLLVVSTLVIIFMGKILAPLMTGIVLAYVMQGIIKVMKKYHIPNGLAVAGTFVLFLGGFVGFLFFVIPRVWRQMRSLFLELPNMIRQTQGVLQDLPSSYPLLLSEAQVKSWGEMLNAEAGDLGQRLLTFSISQLPVVVTVAVYMVLVPILVFFILKDKDAIINWCQSFLPEKRDLVDRIGTEMDMQMSNYVRGKVIEIILVSTSTYLLFVIFGLNYAALLAFLVGLSVIIPYLGFVVVTLPVFIIAYLQFGLTEHFFYLLGWYSVVQGIDGFVLVPLLFSEAVNLHPIAIITAVLVFGSWWGLWGVFFAIPLATMIKVIMTSWPQAVADTS